MDSNNMTALHSDSFGDASVSSLETLSLASNRLLFINTRDLGSLTHLVEFSLRDNLISDFIVNGAALNDLQVLDLSQNMLRFAPLNLSLFAPNLILLNISFNLIDLSLLHPTYAMFTQLRTLDISGNPLHVLDGTTLLPLCQLPGLASLHLVDTGLFDIDPSALACFNQLTELNLGLNAVATESVVFDALKQLAANGSHLLSLGLQEMGLREINATTLSLFGELRELDLAHNVLRTINESVFDSLSKLAVLDLQDNRLVHIDSLEPLRYSLRRLLLQDNSIVDIALGELRAIEEIRLDHNSLTSIPRRWLVDMDSIVLVLNASHNAIRSIHPEAFVNVTIDQLDLSHNRLVALHGFGSLHVTSLMAAYNMLAVLDNGTFDESVVKQLEVLDLSYNNLSHFPDSSDKCPHFATLQKLNLAHNYLGDSLATAAVDSLHFFRRLERLQYLDLAANSIHAMHALPMRHLKHLILLDLRANDVNSLDDILVDSVAMSLGKLVLAANRIQVVSVKSLRQYENLKEIDLSYNPFTCNCSLLPFLLWLNSSDVDVLYVTDKRSYRCAAPVGMRGEHVQGATVGRLFASCTPHLMSVANGLTVVLIISLSLLLAAVLVSVATCRNRISQHVKDIHYRWQIRYREVSGVEIANDAPN